MPSTRKQKAKERRSRQLDMLSDVENVDIMLGSYSRDAEENNISKNEVNLDSGSSRPQQSSNVIGEDFRSLLNTISRENSEITIETTRLINDEISSQLSRKLNEIKTSLNSQIQNAILAAITDTVLPSIQNTLSKQGEPNFTIVDPRCNEPHQGSKAASSASKNLRSSEQQRNPGAEITQETWGKRSKTSPVEENHRHMSRDSSVDSYDGEQNHDIYCTKTTKKLQIFELSKILVQVPQCNCYRYSASRDIVIAEIFQGGTLPSALKVLLNSVYSLIQVYAMILRYLWRFF